MSPSNESLISRETLSSHWLSCNTHTHTHTNLCLGTPLQWASDVCLYKSQHLPAGFSVIRLPDEALFLQTQSFFFSLCQSVKLTCKFIFPLHRSPLSHCSLSLLFTFSQLLEISPTPLLFLPPSYYFSPTSFV